MKWVADALWVEKYRPATVDALVATPDIKTWLNDMIANKSIPHLLLAGRPGAGKTTIAKILISHIPCDSLVINASDENNVETIRTRVKAFASTMSMDGIKIIVLDEADYITPSGQAALRYLIEQFSATTRFILTANFPEKIIEPLISRMQQIDLVPPSVRDVALHMVEILKAEGIEYPLEQLRDIIDYHYPDIRKIIGVLQQYASRGLPFDRSTETDYKSKILAILQSKQPHTKQFTQIRQLIANNRIQHFAEAYTYLYQKIDDFAPNKVAECILALADGQYKDAFVVDKEICFMASIYQLLTILKG
jgi:DNA polymerase III delta prime subunit